MRGVLLTTVWLIFGVTIVHASLLKWTPYGQKKSSSSVNSDDSLESRPSIEVAKSELTITQSPTAPETSAPKRTTSWLGGGWFGRGSTGQSKAVNASDSTDPSPREPSNNANNNSSGGGWFRWRRSSVDPVPNKTPTNAKVQSDDSKTPQSEERDGMQTEFYNQLQENILKETNDTLDPVEVKEETTWIPEESDFEMIPPDSDPKTTILDTQLDVDIEPALTGGNGLQAKKVITIQQKYGFASNSDSQEDVQTPQDAPSTVVKDTTFMVNKRWRVDDDSVSGPTETNLLKDDKVDSRPPPSYRSVSKANLPPWNSASNVRKRMAKKNQQPPYYSGQNHGDFTDQTIYSPDDGSSEDSSETFDNVKSLKQPIIPPVDQQDTVTPKIEVTEQPLLIQVGKPDETSAPYDRYEQSSGSDGDEGGCILPCCPSRRGGGDRETTSSLFDQLYNLCIN